MALNEEEGLNELLLQQLEKEAQLKNNVPNDIKKSTDDKQNNTASLFNTFSILLIILGVIVSLIICALGNLFGGIVLAVSCLIFSAFMKAIAEIIQLLEDIKNKLSKK